TFILRPFRRGGKPDEGITRDEKIEPAEGSARFYPAVKFIAWRCRHVGCAPGTDKGEASYTARAIARATHSAESMPISVRSRRPGTALARAVAAANTTSLSIGAWAGRSASAQPSCAIVATRLSCVTVRAASVATTMRSVLDGVSDLRRMVKWSSICMG